MRAHQNDSQRRKRGPRALSLLPPLKPPSASHAHRVEALAPAAYSGVWRVLAACATLLVLGGVLVLALATLVELTRQLLELGDHPPATSEKQDYRP